MPILFKDRNLNLFITYFKKIYTILTNIDIYCKMKALKVIFKRLFFAISSIITIINNSHHIEYTIKFKLK